MVTVMERLFSLTSTRPCSDARDGRFAVAKEASAEPQSELSRFVVGRHAGRERRRDCFGRKAVPLALHVEQRRLSVSRERFVAKCDVVP